ncbi:MAG: MBL fold metallo-hydrolase [Opitutaceae bacterium]|nr:MBL fold metallo-hydrolase [Opitutaceae bacterium]
MRLLLIFLALVGGSAWGRAAETNPVEVKALKITVLSTMLAEKGLGEWGFAALVEVDGRRILFDTGAHTDVVLKNAAALQIDLSTVPDVILSHSHWDHVGGLMTLRDSVRKQNPAALGTVHGAEGLFYRRVGGGPPILENPLLLTRPAFEDSGGVFKIHPRPIELHPGVWFSGPVPRPHPERNWSGSGRLVDSTGAVVEDIQPEDAALYINTAKGLVVITGCGHAGVVNLIEHARTVVRPAPVHALIGGIHLFNASEQTLTWTADKPREFRVEHFIGAHCTGLETVYRFRRELGLDRTRVVVGATGAVFELGQGIDPGVLAK